MITIIDNNATRRSSFHNEFNKHEHVGDNLDDGYGSLANKVRLEDAIVLFIHSGNDYCSDFINEMNEQHPNLLIVLYSGGTAEVENENMANLTIQRGGGQGGGIHFNLSNPYQVIAVRKPITTANDFGIITLLEELKNEPSNTNIIREIKKVLGFDEKVENLTEAIFTAIYEQKGEDAIEEAISKRDKYIKEKSKN